MGRAKTKSRVRVSHPQRPHRRLELLGDISRRLALSESPRKLLEEIFREVASEIGAELFANFMVDASGVSLCLECSLGLTEAQRAEFATLPFGASLSGLAAQRRERLVFKDLPSLKMERAAGIVALGVRAYATHPLLAGERVIGTIAFGSRRLERFKTDDVLLMKTVADQVAAALERQRLEALARESEAQFRTLVALSPDAVFINQGNRVVYMNQQGLRLWRATNETDVIGMEPLALIHPGSRDLVRERIRQIVEHRVTQPLQELQIVTLDGHAVDVETTAAAFEFRGAPAIQVFVRDVSSRRRAEETLRYSEEKYAKAFASNAAAIAVTRLDDGVVLEVNDTWVRLCGYRREEIVGRTARAMWPSVESAARFVQFVREHGEVQGWEQSFRKKSGELFTVELWTKRLEIRGEIVILSTLVDITARRKAEEALRMHQAVLEETGRIAKVGGWNFDVATGEGYWTDEVARIHDLDPSDPTSREIGLSFYTGPSRLKVEAAIHAAVERGEPYDLELELISAKGVRKWVRTIGHPVLADGRVVSVRGSFQDITAQKTLESQFLRVQRMEAVGTLASGIAHDLNNILAPVIMMIPNLREKLTDPRDREDLDLIERTTQRGASIIRQLLTFGRGVEGVRGPVQIRHLLREMEAIMRETFPREIEIVTEVSPDLWTVTADATQLHQVLMNLCVNARDAMPRGGRLTLGARNGYLEDDEAALHPPVVPGPCVVVFLHDTGEGIPQENLARIFDPFFTTKAIGKGTGLGLSTVLGIVKSHRGCVKVESQRGGGTTFTLHLPAHAEDVAVATPARETLARGQQETLLLVDDEDAVRSVIARILELNGYQVHVAANGKDALATFQQHRHDIQLVLTDLMMPDMGGVALVRSLHSVEPDLKIVAMSGLEDTERTQELMALGVAEFVSKPCTAAELLDALRRQLAHAPTSPV